MDQSILQNLDIEPPTEENTGNWKRDLISCLVKGLPEVSGGGGQGNIDKVSKGKWEHEPIFREQGNKTLQIRGRKRGKQISK